MIVDRYDPVNLLELIPELRLEMEPELAQLDRVLEEATHSSYRSRPTCPSAAPTPRGSGATPPRLR